MATRASIRSDGNDRQATIQWSGILLTDDGAGVFIGDLDDVSAQAVGDATTVVMQGSQDNLSWAPIGTGITLTIAAGITPVLGITPKPKFIRPLATGASTGTVVTVVGTRRT